MSHINRMNENRSGRLCEARTRKTSTDEVRDAMENTGIKRKEVRQEKMDMSLEKKNKGLPLTSLTLERIERYKD